MRYTLTVDCPHCHVSKFKVIETRDSQKNIVIDAACIVCGTRYFITIGKEGNEKEL